MSEDEEYPIEEVEEFKYTALVKINPKQSTLPIDTAAEWFKGFNLVNYIIYLLGKAIYIEEYKDELGVLRKIPKVHPQLLAYMQERRKLQDQIWKISGGEAVLEGKKEFFKKQAEFIFQMSQDKEFKKKYKSQMEKTLEVEIFEVDDE